MQFAMYFQTMRDHYLLVGDVTLPFPKEAMELAI